MVFFTCNACGQAVKKNQVEKHYQFQCRNCTVLSCMDCGKDFHGDEYMKHTKCITEDEKYGGKDFKPKPSSNKGEVKQEEWINHIKHTIATTKVKPVLQQLLEQLTTFTNIPRKRKKFENFVRNCVKVYDFRLIEEAWTIFDQAQKKKPNSSIEKNSSEKQANNQNENQTEENTKHKGKKNKRTHNELENDHEESKSKKFACNNEEKIEDTSAVDGNDIDEKVNGNKKKFRWGKIILAILKEKSGNEISLKKLRKKVLSEYYASGGEKKPMTENELNAKFQHKVTKNPKFKVHKEKVKLVI